MRKFSKLNEGIKIDEDKIDQHFKSLGCEYKIYNYYLNPTGTPDYSQANLMIDIREVDNRSLNSKLIIITPTEERLPFVIDDWKKLSFNSDSFYFNDFDVNFYTKLIQIISNLKEYNPKICLKENLFLVLLEGDKVSSDELKIKIEMDHLYKKINDTLKEDFTANTQDQKSSFYKPVEGIDFYSNTNNLYVRFVSTAAWEMALSSLCTQMASTPGYSWMEMDGKRSRNLNPDLIELRDYVNQHGFNITYKTSDYHKKNTFQLILEEI